MTLRIPQPRKLTYADYLTFPHDGSRHEILDGEHAVNPGPVPYHQIVLTNLLLKLLLAIKVPGRGLVLPAPLCVELGPHDIVEPDIVVLLNERLHLMVQTRIRGAPSLLVEVLSRSTRSHDRVRKKARYAKSGVPEYWIVDPEAKTIEQWVLEGADYRRAATASERVRLAVLPDVELVLDDVFAAPPFSS